MGSEKMATICSRPPSHSPMQISMIASMSAQPARHAHAKMPPCRSVGGSLGGGAAAEAAGATAATGATGGAGGAGGAAPGRAGMPCLTGAAGKPSSRSLSISAANDDSPTTTALLTLALAAPAPAPSLLAPAATGAGWENASFDAPLALATDLADPGLAFGGEAPLATPFVATPFAFKGDDGTGLPAGIWLCRRLLPPRHTCGHTSKKVEKLACMRSLRVRVRPKRCFLPSGHALWRSFDVQNARHARREPSSACSDPTRSLARSMRPPRRQGARGRHEWSAHSSHSEP
jgi:hypothetical protein